MQDNEKEGNDLKAYFLIGPTKKRCQKRGRGFFSRVTPVRVSERFQQHRDKGCTRTS
jgi:hypothetical protein